MKAGFYVLAMTGGTEICVDGPAFSTHEERDEFAKETWAGQDASKGDNVFWADVSETGQLKVGAYMEGDLE